MSTQICFKANVRALNEVNTELERIVKHDKRIREVEEKLLTSISMEPFTNYEGIENDKTISAIQKIVLCQKAIDIFLPRLVKLIEDIIKSYIVQLLLNLLKEISKSYEKYVNVIQTNANNMNEH